MERVGLNCACGSPVFAEIGRPEIVNLPGVTMLVVEHPGTFKCPACGKELVVAVGTVQNLGLMTVPAPQPESKIIKPNGVIPFAPRIGG